MAWIVYDAMPGQDAIGRNTPAVYGPLPCKRWVPVAGEKYKVRKRSPSTAKPQGSPDDVKAVQYARWLASRDRVELPDGDATVINDAITTRAGKLSRRARAVSFKGSNVWPVSILLPNWDFDPAPAVESTVDAETVFADLLPCGLALLADALADSREDEPARELEAA